LDRLSADGLLRRSLEFIENLTHPRKESGQSPPLEEAVVETAVEQPTPEQRLERLWAGLTELERGIEAPGRLFSLIKEQLQLERSALLLYEPTRMAFVPWAMHGFDPTTSHRLRIPLKVNDTMNRLASGKIHLLSSPEELHPFSQFFSFREFSTLTHLLLVPFIYENRFLGLLLCANLEPADLEPFRILSEKASRRLHEARERHLEGARRETPQRPESLKESVRAASAECLHQGSSPLLIRISTGTLIETLGRRNPYIDPYRLHQDVSRVLLSLFRHIGSVFEIDGERILIVACNPAQPIQEEDAEMLLHHLKATLIRLMPELSTDPGISLDEQVRLPGSDTEEVLTQLAEIV
jgi:hypothetical protein